MCWVVEGSAVLFGEGEPLTFVKGNDKNTGLGRGNDGSLRKGFRGR